MILVAIVALSMVVITALIAALGGIPSMPATAVTSINLMLSYLQMGVGILFQFVDPAPVKAMLAITVTVIGIYEGYKLVMWVASKIPMFGVSDD